MNETLPPALSVVIVTYNSAHVVAEALGALPDEVEIVIVDNASQDESIARARAVRPKSIVVETGANLGFARAVNAGVARAQGRYLLLLNPDAVIEAGAVAEMLRVLEADVSIGVAAPLVTESDGSLTTLAAGYEPSIGRMFTHATGLSRLARRIPALRGHYLLRGQYKEDALLDVRWVSGGCLFTRRDSWSQLDGLIERWFMYAEDVEFCLRVGDAGQRVVLVPWVHAAHAVGGSSGGEAKIRTMWLENLYDLYQLHYGAKRIRQFTWRAVVATGFTARSLIAGLRAAVSGGVQGYASDHDRRRFLRYASALLAIRRRDETPASDVDGTNA